MIRLRFQRVNLNSPTMVTILVSLMYIVKAGVKIVVGTLINSPMIAGDGYHNFFDLMEQLGIRLVIYLADRPASREYPLGLRNLEVMATGAIGIGLWIVAVQFFLKSIAGVVHYLPEADHALRAIMGSWLPAYQPLSTDIGLVPLLLTIMVLSAVFSRLAGAYQIRVGTATGHPATASAGEETMSDSWIEIPAAVGVVVERLPHMGWLEYPLALAVTGLILNAGCKLVVKAFKILNQATIGQEHDTEIGRIALSMAGVLAVPEVITRQVGGLAVVEVKVVTRLEQQANWHVRDALKERINAYLTGEEFAQSRVKVRFEKPQTDWHRVAFALVTEGNASIIAPSLAEASDLLVCGIEEGVNDRGEIDPISAGDPVDFMVRKAVGVLYVFGEPQPDAVAALSERGIELRRSESYLPTAMGVQEY